MIEYTFKFVVIRAIFFRIFCLSFFGGVCISVHIPVSTSGYALYADVLSR